MSAHRVTVQSLCQFAKLIWLAHAGITEMSDIITELRGKLKRKKKLNSHRTLRSVEHHHLRKLQKHKKPNRNFSRHATGWAGVKAGTQGHSPCQEPGGWWPQPCSSRPRRSWAEWWPRCRTVASGTLTHPCSQNKLHKNSSKEVTQHFLKKPAVLQVTSMSPTAQALRAVPSPASHPFLPSQSREPKAQEHLSNPQNCH